MTAANANGATLTDNSDPQSEANSPRRSEYDANTAQETFYDFTMRNIKELNDQANERHDLSLAKDGLIMYAREMTQEQASSKTSENFIRSITKSKNKKVWEYFVFVPEFSDSLLTPTIEQLTVYHYINKIDAMEAAEYYERTKNQEILTELYDPNERAQFKKDVESFLFSAFRFYGVGTSPGAGYRDCKVLFHDQKKLEFGKMQEVLAPRNFELVGTITEQAQRAKKSLKNMLPEKVLKDRSAKQKKKLEEEIAAGPGLAPGSGQMAFRPQSQDTSSFTQMSY